MLCVDVNDTPEVRCMLVLHIFLFLNDHFGTGWNRLRCEVDAVCPGNDWALAEYGGGSAVVNTMVWGGLGSGERVRFFGLWPWDFGLRTLGLLDFGLNQ